MTWLVLVAMIAVCGLFGLAWYPCCCDDETPSYTECDNCPGGNGPENGYVFTLSGFVDTSSSPCDCPSYDGSYAVPSVDVCVGEQCFSASCCYFYVSPSWQYEFVNAGWEITDLGGGNWNLRVTFLLQRHVNCCGVTSSSWTRLIFDLEKTSSDNCYDVSDESMTLDTSWYETNSFPSGTGCDGSGVTCSVSSY
jgi:hypothetical protein